MSGRNTFLTPHRGLAIALLSLFCLTLFILRPQEPAVFFLWLISLSLLVIRFRFEKTDAWLLVESALWIIVAVFIDKAFLLAYPLAMLLIYHGRHYALALPFLLWLVFAFLDFEVLGAAFFVSVSGILLKEWKAAQETAQKRVDTHREQIHGFEREREYLLANQEEVSRMSALSERDRIAQQLHDDLGHELTGALLALRAFEVKEPESSKNDSFRSLQGRLEASLAKLRETVENTKTEEELGFERFRDILQNFDYCPLEQTRRGDIEAITPMHWHLLASVVKEALTNVQKHSRASKVEIDLYVDASIVRLLVKNDGIREQEGKDGTGLRFMRRRLEGVGGTLSIHADYHFTIVCVIPLRLEGTI